MTSMELVAWGLTTLVTAFVGSFLAGYLKRKGENLATHEDIDKLVDQVAAVTTTAKEIEARISNEAWRRERRSDLQLKAIENFSALTSDFIQRSIADNKYVPNVDWFSTFCAADAAVRALFDDEVYKTFKAVEVLVGPGLGYGSGAVMAVNEFIERRDAAVKLMYGRVLNTTIRSS